MNNRIIIAVVAIIIVGLAIFALTRKADSPATVESQTENTQSVKTEANVETGSIKSLIAKGGNQKCEFKYDEQGTKSEGIVYVSGGKMRGDFNVEASNVKTASHMIYDGTTSYMWMDGQNTGFKMALDAQAQSQAAQAIDTNKNYEYHCENWSADTAKFTLPSGVTFNEIPTMPTGADASAGAGANAGANANTKTLQQAACNNLPEPAKSQCLSAIK